MERKLHYGFRDKAKTQVVISDDLDGLPCDLYHYSNTVSEYSNEQIINLLHNCSTPFKVCLNLSDYFYED